MLINHTKYQVIYIERNYKIADQITLPSQMARPAVQAINGASKSGWSNHIT